MTETKMPPSSMEAEEAILGAIIANPIIIDEVSAYLSDNIFYYDRNKRLYSIILKMLKDGEEIDSITISGRLTSADKDSGVTAYYLSGLLENAGTSGMALRYAIQVYEKHLLRQVIGQSIQISESAYQNGMDVYNILDDDCACSLTIFLYTKTAHINIHKYIYIYI